MSACPRRWMSTTSCSASARCRGAMAPPGTTAGWSRPKAVAPAAATTSASGSTRSAASWSRKRTCSTASTAPRSCSGCRRSWSLPSPAPRPPHPDRRVSPDTDSILGGDVQRIALRDLERVVPRIDVAQRRERADVARRMGAVDELLAQRVVAPQRAPYLRPAPEEALLAGEAVDHRCRLAAQRTPVGLQGDGQAAEVADVLAHRDLAVDVHVRQLRELVAFVLRPELGRLRFELARVFRGPPVAQQAVAVGLAPLVVEAVDDLVADHAA